MIRMETLSMSNLSSKAETKDIIKTETKPDDNIYSRIKFE